MLFLESCFHQCLLLPLLNSHQNQMLKVPFLFQLYLSTSCRNGSNGKQMWLVGLWPLKRAKVMWAKFIYAMTLTSIAALTVTALAIRAIDLPPVLGFVQASGTFCTCLGLCGLAVGLGARMPSYHETNTGRISSGLGGTVNLIASVGLVTVSVGLFGGMCYLGASRQRLDSFGWIGMALFAALVLLGVGTAAIAMRIGIRSFRKQQF